MSSSDPKAPAPAPVHRLLVSLSAGVAVGLFLGERAQVFSVVADAFVRLMQMAVLPYVTVSIIGGIGGLTLDHVRTLGLRAVAVLAGLWALALTFVFLMPLMFPERESAAFFSTTLLEKAPPLDFVSLYIPTNPFAALAESVVPAVVVFSMFVGIALIGVPRKQGLLDGLAVASATLGRVMRIVVKLMPYGLFAIVATAAGTLRLEQASRLELFLAGYTLLGLLLALWVLPGLIAAITPIPYRAVFAETRDALLTAFVVADLFVVLPVLVAACRTLIARHGGGEQHAGLPDVIVPVSYNFPHSGKLLSASFILFAAWFSDTVIAPTDYPRLGVTALVTLFSHTMTAIPFLLDVFRVPADTIQLFIASSVVNSRVGALVAAMHTTAMALLCSCAVSGAMRWRPVAVARYAVITILLTGFTLVGTRMAAQQLLPPPADADTLASMRVDLRAESTIATGTPPTDPPPAPGDRLTAIGARRVLRVAYLPDALPFAYINGRGELAGFDVALMHRLAREFGVSLAFMPLDRETLDRRGGADALLRSGAMDIIIGGMAVTTTRAGLMQLAPYLDETAAFVVPDDARRKYESWAAIRDLGAQTILIPNLPYYVEQLRARLPEVQWRTVSRMDEALAGNIDADALAIPAERGSAWTLRYPRYSVAVPSPALKVPLALAMPRDEPDLTAFVTTSMNLKRKDGTLDALYEYWILGRGVERTEPRWSIIRNVLHWVP